MNKLGSLIQSRRFWVAILGLITVAAEDTLGLNPDQVESVGIIVIGWILGDSLNKTGDDQRGPRL